MADTAVQIPTEEEIRSYGWNSIVHDNPTGNAAVVAEQLTNISLLLLAILERLKADD